VGIEDRWAAYQLDAAVTLVGTAIESALHEMQEVGAGERRRLVPRYTLAQLLDPGFRLPPPERARSTQGDGLAALKALARRRGSGVKLVSKKT